VSTLPVSFVCYVPDDPKRWLAVSQGHARFFSEVGRHAGSPLKTYRAPHDAPETDFLLLAGADVRTVLALYPLAVRASFARRLIPINVSRPKIFESILEPLAIPGAVDPMSIVEWEHDENRPGAWGLFGIRDVGAKIGAACVLYSSERYCFLQSDAHRGLPDLLVSYLTAYAAARTAEHASAPG
jgi:hypothetical protein